MTTFNLAQTHPVAVPTFCSHPCLTYQCLHHLLHLHMWIHQKIVHHCGHTPRNLFWEDSLPVTPRTPSSIESLDSSVYPIDSEGRIHSLPLDNNESLHNLRIDKLFLEHNVSIHTNQFTILEHNVSSPSDSTAFEYEKLVEPLPVGFWSNPPVWL